MDPNRSKTKEAPFPGNGSIPLKLREIFHSAGIEPTAERRIDWEDLPYALYDKGLYLSGLPARLFFTKDNPSAEEQVARLNVLLKWPFPGVENPLKLLEQACTFGRLVMLRRPQDRDVVFEVIREDGSKMDIRQWKAPRPPTSHPKLPAISSFSLVATSSNSTQTASPTLRLTTSGPYSNGGKSKPMSPASPSTPTSKSKLTATMAQPGNQPPAPQKISSVPTLQTAQSTSKVSGPRAEPYPESKNMPLKLREIFKQADIPESRKYPGRVNWKALPETLWLSGRYITGIRAAVILGSMDPTIREIREVKERPLKFSLPKAEVEKMEKSLERGRVRLLPRPKNRDVVLEVTTDDGALDIGRWNLSTAKTPDILEPPSLQKLKNISVRRKVIIDASSDEFEILTPETPQSKKVPIENVPPLIQPSPFPRSREVSLEFRRIFEKAGVEEDPQKPGLIPWADLPHFLWRNGWYITGLPEKLVLGAKTMEKVIEEPWDPSSRWHDHETPQLLESLRKGKVKLARRPADRNVVFQVFSETGRSTDIGQWRERQPSSPAESNVPSDTEMDTNIQPEKEGEDDGKPPLIQWKDEVNDVVDQLSEMFVQSGVKLPLNPSRPNAYKIPWSDLPRLLHDAQVTLAGFPLNLLPYWKAQEKLNGKWVVTWKRPTLNHMIDLLDNDGIGVEKWTAGSNAVVQALDEDNSDEYTFTYDDFVNAKNDDPEHVAINGQISGPVEYNHAGKRKRVLSAVTQEDRAPKRQKTLDDAQSLPAARTSRTGTENKTDSDYDTAANSGRSTSKENRPERDASSDYYDKPSHDPELTVAELNSKYRRQKEIIKDIIAILSEPCSTDSSISKIDPDLIVYHDIPCIAPEDESLDFFLPWSNLPRYLAARMVYLAGWPSLCAPIVQDDRVVTEFGPASWDDGQWTLMENALLNDAIDVKKSSNKQLFQLVDANGEKQMSIVNFSRLWLETNWGIEADQSVTIFAKDVSIMDPIVVETDDEGDGDEVMDVD